MGYQISYGLTGEAKRIELWKVRFKKLGVIGVGILCFLSILWISGVDLPAMISAMEEMAGTLSQGEDFADAFSAFCIDILQGAECG